MNVTTFSTDSPLSRNPPFDSETVLSTTPENSQAASKISSVAQTNIKVSLIKDLPKGNSFRFAHPLYPNANYAVISIDDLEQCNKIEKEGIIKIHFNLRHFPERGFILLVYDIF